MSITENNYRNFYFGTSAELYIQSELYAFGYEAYKVQPDIGFDICASNNALMKFCNEDRKVFNIQVKARLINLPNFSRTRFYISHSDFDLLKNDATSVLVCVLVRPMLDKAWNSFDYSNHREASLMIENSIFEEATRQSFLLEGNLSIGELEDRYDIREYQKNYFWLQSHHLKRIDAEGYFYDTHIGGVAYKSLEVIAGENSIELRNAEKDYNNMLAAEMQNIKYLVDTNVACRSDLDCAKMFVEDY